MNHHHVPRVTCWWSIALLALVSLAACHLDDLTTRPPSVPSVRAALSDVADSAVVGRRAPHTMPVVLTGPAGSALDWSARLASPATWLTVSPASGHAPDGHDTLSLSLLAGDLAPGTYADTVVVTASGDTTTAQVAVRLIVLDCGVTRFSVGESIADSLTPFDCQPPGQAGRFARVYMLDAAPGDSVSVSATSSAFTPFLALADSAIAATPLRQGACPAGPSPCLRYVPLTGNGPWRVLVTTTDPGLTGTFTLMARRPTGPDSVSSLRQLRSDGTTTVPRGASVNESTIILSGVATDGDPADSVRLDVEVRSATQPFQGVATTSGAALPQGPASLRLTGLADGSYRWQARVTDQTGRSSAWVPFGPGGGPDFTIATPATGLAFIGQSSNTVAGSAMSPAVTVTARKPNGQTDTAFSGPIALSLSGGVGASLGGTVTRTAVRGVADFADLHVDRAGSGYTLLAQAPGLAGATSTAFSIAPANAARLVVTAQPGDVAAGAAIPPPPGATALDAYGNTATGYAGAVTVSIAAGTGASGATLTGTRTVNANSGVATFGDLRIDRAGTGYQLAVTAAGVTGAQTAGFRVIPGAPTTLAILVQPSDTKSGQTIAPAVQVAVRDAFGNVVTTYTGTVTVALGKDPNVGLSTLSGTLSGMPVNGVATFSDLRIDLTGSGFTLRFSSADLPTVESATFNVTF